MRKSSKHLGIYFVLLLGLFISIHYKGFAQRTTPEALRYSGTLTFLDGTPVNFGDPQTDEFSITNTEFPNVHAADARVKKDSLFLSCLRPGKHILSFLDQEIARFDVVETAGKLQTSLSHQLRLPFNYIVLGDPGDRIHIFSKTLTLLETLTLPESGKAGIRYSLADFQDKFMAFQKEEQFLEPFVFQQNRPADQGKLNTRQFRTGKQTLQPKKGLVHNLTDDTYYSVQQVFFSDMQKNNSLFLLKRYDARNRKAALYPINFDPGEKSGNGMVALDYLGNLVFIFADQQYRLSNTGQVSATDDIYVSPIYQFQDHFVKGGRWIVPVFAGIPLPEGMHTFEINCQGKEASATSIESFQVVFDPNIEKLWRMYSPLDQNDRNEPRFIEYCAEVNPAFLDYQEKINKIHSDERLNPEARQKAIEAIGKAPTPYCLQWKKELADPGSYYYYPSGYDPDSRLPEITVKECHISIDGKANLLYSYIDETLLKGIHYADWDSEAQKQKALESAMENARREIGFSPEGNPWNADLNLFTSEQKLVNGEPLNMIEGPYPELRYQVWKVNGEYPDRKEAEKHCKTPYRTSSGKYQCREEVIVKICPDNFSVKMVDGRVTTDYEALQCGTADPIENTSQGEEIVVEFSKAGYITETRALSLRTLEAGEILLSGHVRDDQGVELEGVQVKLRKLDGLTQTDKAGIYNLIAKAQGKAPHSETMDIKLKKIGIEIIHEELGIYEGKPWGIVSDGFTTLELKVKANGIRPNTVSVKQPELGQFVERTMLKVPLVLDGAGEGVMEYVPPEYLTNEQLNVPLPLSDTSQAGAGMRQNLWAAEVPVRITYEDEQGKPGVMEFRIYVTRPPVFLIHGFTGNETTWADLGVFLRARKFNALIYEYYQGPVDESTIPRQSQKLGQYIQDVRKCYKANGFYQTRIDIVAHSMGGLISRHYISNMARYGEKAGIVIPYNVKLSQDELAAQRFQKPVIMNDVRKLIMVGTPNHGSSFIDGTIGHLCAILDDNHQLANAQLRSNSPFITELNAGEREGRHLSPNVQYALLYGIRRVSPLYPPDALGNYYAGQAALLERPLAYDDGVVTIESARLNGVIDFHFPQERTIYSNSPKYHFYAPVGFIHSPATSFVFQGDKSITTSEEIFNKATEFLLEDIPRAPLKNAYARIIQAEGKVSMRYFAHHDWQAIAPGARTQLENPWCSFQTGEGSLSIGFFLDGHHWASLHLQPHTVLQLEHAAPELVQIYLQEGKARFRSRKQGGGGFEVVMGEETEQWYTFNPKARVNDLQTDFIIEAGDEFTVQSLSGQVLISVPSGEKGQAAIIGSAEGKRITAKGTLLDYPLPESGWWMAIDTSYLPDEAAEPAVEASDTTRTNLAANGSFEQGPDFSRYIVLNTGDSIPGWTVVAGTVDITDQSYQPSEGKRSLDLLGTTRVGSIRQTISTSPGQYYLVQFDLAGNPLGVPAKKLMEVAAAGQSRSFTFSIEGKAPQNMGWETHRFVFAATGDTTALLFTGNNTEGPGGAGAMIDHVRVFAISGEEAMRIMEEDQPIQHLGEVATKVSTRILPVGGFTQLFIQARNDAGDPLVSPYEVKVDLENARQLTFININSANQVIDAQGQYAAHITISEPDPQQYASLSAIPLEATFRVQLIHPRSKVVQYEEMTTLPLGMTLLYGTTLGPGYQPRQEPVPPEFYETRYQLANQNDAQGNFYILFNTTLFEEDIERFRQHADRTSKIFSMDQFDFHLEWSANCSVPLRYVLPDSILHKLKAGRQVSVGKNGYIDLLSPPEHEGRIKAQVSRFIEAMPLEVEAKSRVIQQLNRITFRYNSDARYPNFSGRPAQTGALEMPPADIYWRSEFLNSTENPAFNAMIHLIGHFLRDAIIGQDQPSYDFLAGNCRGQETIWTHRIEEQKDLFDPARYIAFQEAGADFFAYLMMHFIQTHEPEFVNKSVYFHPGYLQEFKTSDKARAIKDKFPAYAVSGMQTTFWVAHYGTACADDPARVFADFLLTQGWYTQLTEYGEPASTFLEWLQARVFTPLTEFLIPGPDPREAAQTWGLIPPRQARLAPIGPKADAEVDIDGRSVRNFPQIPAIYLDAGKAIQVTRTAFELWLPGADAPKVIRLEPGAQLGLGIDFEPNLISGAFRFRSAVDFRTPLATCQAKSTDFLVRLEEEETLFETYNGSLSLKSEKDEEAVMAGEGTSVNKRGRIKKATQLKKLPPPAQQDKYRHPFLMDRILQEMPQGYRR